MGKIIIEGNSVAEVIALALSMQGGGNVLAAQGVQMPVTSTDDDDNTPVNTAAPQFDATGLPWDERIHASSKALTDKNVWRAKRGVAKELVAQVEAELRAQTGGAAANAQVLDPMQTTQVQMPQNPANGGGMMGGGMVAQTPQVQQMPMGGMGQQPVQQAMGGGMMGGQATVTGPVVPQDGPALMKWVGENLASGKINQEELAWLSSQIGLTSITDVISNPAKVAPAVALLQQHGKM